MLSAKALGSPALCLKCFLGVQTLVWPAIQTKVWTPSLHCTTTKLWTPKYAKS
jgi:hypothetical protein